MRLTVVGCSGSYPGPDSPASCYLSRPTTPTAAPGGSCSTSAAARSARCTGTSTRSAIDAVLLSHLHADHCLDLCGYYVLRKYHPDGPQPRIPVWGPAGTADRMARAYDLPADPGMTEEFDFRDLGRAGRRSGRSRSSPSPVDAPGAGVRPAGDAPTARPLAYSGDTGPCAGLDAGRRRAPTCCSPRRRSAPATTTRRTST